MPSTSITCANVPRSTCFSKASRCGSSAFAAAALYILRPIRPHLLKGPEEGDQILSFPVGEDKVQAPLVVANHVIQCGCDPIMEVRRTRGQRAQRGSLEFPEVAP